MEKRLFYRDPSTGEETPLLVYQVDTTTVSDLSVNKQDKTDDSLETTDKTVVGAINELNELVQHAVYEPFVEGAACKVLVYDASHHHTWQNIGDVVDISTSYDPVTQALRFVIINKTL